MDFDKGADGFLVDMREELSKYQLWLRRKDNQLIACTFLGRCQVLLSLMYRGLIP